ncbi:penicillin acylase family protein [Peredibacter starrii]|uniref:Penicillin acylase family protein n=1 Tax=Peredibacter starrii TaxID=28202 RepID=A0AAX4HNU8_9BACT|nr:penicillin acylase family protein [Peredibacter starrii]WPU64845.1 penicillin acylase family protein [Peredibacter starrii]
MLYLVLSFFLSSAFAATYECKATFGDLNIPHQKVQNQDEAAYCFGFHHAHDRAWEMDYFRRVGQGRNSEVLGFSQLRSDLMMRLLNLEELANKLWSEFPADRKRLLELYAEGANAGFIEGKRAKEFQDKGYEPEPWKPEHTVLILLLQSFDQTRKTFFRDYEEEKVKAKWGNLTEELFDEDHMPWESTILKEGEYLKKETSKTTSTTHQNVKLWAEFPSVFGVESGSNNWAISAKKSKTGHAILANDPHLDLKTPMFWYWIKLETPEGKVMGASVPGVPVIVSGTNGKVAWGLTNSYLNAADVFFAKDAKDSDVETIRPTVWIKIWFFKVPFMFKSFERLKTGQRILPLETDSDKKLVLRWSGFSLKPEEIFPMFDLYKVNNVDEMNGLLTQIGLPSWNFVFADAKGNIGYHLIGKTYLDRSKNPYGISERTLAEIQNEEFLPVENRPQVLRPKREYVYSANNRHWPSDAAFYGGRGYSYSFRGYRIEEMLKDHEDPEAFKKIQCDRKVVDARFFLPKIQKYLNADEFRNWDMLATNDSKVLPLYRRLLDLTFEKWEVNEYALFKLLDDLDEKQILEFKTLFEMAKNDISNRSWSEVLRLGFAHMSKNESWVFSPELPGVGDSHSVDPGTAKWNEDRKVFEQYSGASMRMIIEMTEAPKIQLVLPGLNRDYTSSPETSPWESWRSCQYTTLAF